MPELKRLAQLHRDAPSGSLRLGNEIVRGVARVETDVSERQAERIGYARQNFFDWAGDIALGRIDGEGVEEHQRKRLHETARSTVNNEVCHLLRTLQLNGFSPCLKTRSPERKALTSSKNPTTVPEILTLRWSAPGSRRSTP